MIEQGVRTPSFYCNSTTPCLDTCRESPNLFLTLVFLPVQWAPVMLFVLASLAAEIESKAMELPVPGNSRHQERVLSNQVVAVLPESAATFGKCQDQ